MAGPYVWEQTRLDRIAAALRPWTPEVAAERLRQKGLPQGPVASLAWQSQTNFLPLVLDVFSQSMKVDNYIASDTQDTASAWEWWQRNKMSAQQAGIFRSVLAYGAAYCVALPSLSPFGPNAQGFLPGAPQVPVPALERPAAGAFVRPLSPRAMTALYGDPIEWVPGVTPVDTDWPIVAMEINGPSIRLYDEDKVHFIGVQNVPTSALGWRASTFNTSTNFEYIDSRTHGVGVCPVVRFRDRWTLEGDDVFGIIEPLLSIQSRIDETIFEMLVSQYFTAFTQRWVAGWRPKDDDEMLRMAASDTWFFDKDSVKVGQFAAGDLKAYLDSQQSAKRDLAAVAQVPAQNLGIEGIANISEATLAALEAGKDRKAAEIQTSLGESFEQLLRTAAHLTGDEKGANDFDAEVRWQDTTARSFAQTVDGLGKLTAMLGIPEEMAWEAIPGWTHAMVERAKTLRDEQRAKMLTPQPKPGPMQAFPDSTAAQ
jgi:hypothetical protein